MECRDEEGVVFMGGAFRELPGRRSLVATNSVARSWTAREHPVRVLRAWVSPPAVDHGRQQSGTPATGAQPVSFRLPCR
jgi:hypothetical protein